ncbi:MAG: hypothetical protein JWQ57_1684, partial [Mucilaginibacter sp.]|nr:hypothetical protein [Mucilaginibacter sp.]
MADAVPYRAKPVCIGSKLTADRFNCHKGL